jgi:hypothetical protein
MRVHARSLEKKKRVVDMNQVWMFGSRIDERLHRKRDMKGTVPGSPGSLEASPTPLIFDSYMGQSASMY